MGKMIYDTRELDVEVEKIREGVDKAVVAAAFKVRDDIRKSFLASKGDYKYATSGYEKLAQGIMVGRLQNSQIKVHALGNNVDQSLWKTRFFVGGTVVRRGKGTNGTPFTKGFIKHNSAVDKGTAENQNTLGEFIKNAIDNGK